MPLEASVNPRNRRTSVSEMVRQRIDRVNWVCTIESQVKCGTGLLVGPDLVLTSYHVVEPLYEASQAIAEAAFCRFNFIEDSGAIHKGTQVKLARNWREESLPKSRYSKLDEDGADTGFEIDCLDYALIRLAEPVGERRVDGPDPYTSARRRWMPLRVSTYHPADKDPICVFQHAAGAGGSELQPQAYDDGKIIAVVDGGIRLRHDADTSSGSSGGPCFNEDLELVGLHQAGHAHKKWNQAVPIDRIVADIRGKGFERLLGVEPPARPPAPRQRMQEVGVAVREDAIERRLRNAVMLMDRDQLENLIKLRRSEAIGIIHVIACRQADNHPNFVERLRYLSLHNLGRDALKRRHKALLGEIGKGGGQPWEKDPLDWPGDNVSQRDAAAMLAQQVDPYVDARKPVILEAIVDIAGHDQDRDFELLSGLGKHLAARGASPDFLQILVVFEDRTRGGEPDQQSVRRKELGEAWLKRRPRGCGASYQMLDVGSFELQAWGADVQSALGLEQREILQGVDLAFAHNARVPMAEAEKRVSTIIRPLLDAAK